ncbi:hypothetical protein A2U01_0069555, partial [Trifolium medium]|nr:hypothetical protein [Trifolium medium]
MHGSMRISACHFSHIGFFQSGESRWITLANQGGNTAVSFGKTRYQLKNQTVIVDRSADIPQL